MRQQGGNIRGQSFVKAIQQGIEEFGETITLPDGSHVPANVTSLDVQRAMTWLPQSAVNAGNPDPLLVDVPATYITDPAIENKQIIRQGTHYTVTRVGEETLSDRVVIYRLCVYRSPVADASADDIAQEALFEYVPPSP